MTQHHRRILKIKLLLEAEQADTLNGPAIKIKPVLAAELAGAAEGDLPDALEVMDRAAEELEGEHDGSDKVPGSGILPLALPSVWSVWP